ncbi:uncharacterized protein J3R85_004848 [Psidium guajava]|nr:uncharacterized protein J3R85_004848 [Psidium guajava]
MMRDFPSCFGESGVQIANSSSSLARSSPQNSVTCIYKSKVRGRPCLITVTWTKTLVGQGLTVSILVDDHGGDPPSSSRSLCRVEIKPWLLISKHRGCRKAPLSSSVSSTLDVHWDLSHAKFGAAPEPVQDYYVAVKDDRDVVLLLGDMEKEANKKLAGLGWDCDNAVLVGKRENVFGKKSYCTRAQFLDKGQAHSVVIECDQGGGALAEPCLVIRIDDRDVVRVRRLRWKFRGNCTIDVDGTGVEVLWDVHNWLFGGDCVGSNYGVFLFQTCPFPAESNNDKFCGSSSSNVSKPSCISSWWTSSSSSSSRGIEDDPHHQHQLQLQQGLGFSLILYAWKSE